MRVILEIAAGQNAGNRHWLGPGQTLTVGRSEVADVALPLDGQISSLHFAVECLIDHSRVRDRDSRNGTFVNGVRIQEAILSDGDEIVAGETKFKVHIESAASAPNAANLVRDPLPTASITPGMVTGRADNLRTIALQRPSLRVNAKASQYSSKEASGESPLADPAMEVLAIKNETGFPVATVLWEDSDGRASLTVIVKATFAIAANRHAPSAQRQLPVFAADVPYSDDPTSSLKYESDKVPFKPRADVVLVGQGHSPKGQPVTQLDVRLRVGNREWRQRVFGDRKWWFPTALVLVPKISQPEPFVTMPLVYERAFGGIDAAAALYCKENLVGAGFIGKLSKESLHGRVLPNLEDPGDLIHSWNSRPKPVGFGFYGRGWMPRLGYAGTYDEKYRRERAPHAPLDFSYLLYNGAHPDLQVDGYLRGDEVVEVENMTLEGNIQFRLPGIRPRISLTRRVSSTAPSILRNEEVRAPLDTLVLVPDEKLFYGVFRAVCPLSSLDDPDIIQITIKM
jgi:pSer/pThr/pTyr-binding forkhead associated (FHA) protein